MERFQPSSPCAPSANQSQTIRQSAIKTYVFGHPDPFLHYESSSGLISPISSVSDIPLSSEGDEEQNPFQLSFKKSRGDKNSLFLEIPKENIQLQGPNNSLPFVLKVNPERRGIRFLREIFLEPNSDNIAEEVENDNFAELSPIVTPSEVIDKLAKQIAIETICSGSYSTMDSTEFIIDISSDFNVQFNEWIDLKNLSDPEFLFSSE